MLSTQQKTARHFSACEKYVVLIWLPPYLFPPLPLIRTGEAVNGLLVCICSNNYVWWEKVEILKVEYYVNFSSELTTKAGSQWTWDALRGCQTRLGTSPMWTRCIPTRRAASLAPAKGATQAPAGHGARCTRNLSSRLTNRAHSSLTSKTS